MGLFGVDTTYSCGSQVEKLSQPVLHGTRAALTMKKMVTSDDEGVEDLEQSSGSGGIKTSNASLLWTR